MSNAARIAAASLLVLGCAGICPRGAAAQPPDAGRPPAAVSPAEGSGRIEGVVTDERGRPLGGVAVTAQGARFAYVVSNRNGTYAFDALQPGPYLVRAQMPGFVASPRTLVNVLPSGATWRLLRLQRTGAALAATAGPVIDRPVLNASIGTAGRQPEPEPIDGPATVDDAHDDSAKAWRLRHLKRSVLRDVTDAGAATGEVAEAEVMADVSQPGLAADLWSGLPLSGQVQFLTTSSFDSTDQLFASGGPRGVAYLALSAPAGTSATWSVQGAYSQGELAAWVLGGSYMGRIGTGHALDAGMSYATQRYASPGALSVTASTLEANRTVGALFAFDEWQVTPTATVTFGARYAHYGYLAPSGGSISPSVTVRWGVVPGAWVRGTIERDTLAPGAEEFVPTPLAGMWLPPQRTFSPVSTETGFEAATARRFELAFERQLASFVVAAHAFRHEVDDQVVTLFGVTVPGGIDEPGHYYTANGGDTAAFGWGVGVSRPVASRVRGSVVYTVTHGTLRGPGGDAEVLAIVAPSVVRLTPERLHDVTTAVETDIPETATRVYAAYRLNTGFASSKQQDATPGFGTRFDVQVAQRLPFLEFTNAEWEVLFAVRNLFRDLETGSYYDELLVVRPPKRVVGGVMVRF